MDRIIPLIIILGAIAGPYWLYVFLRWLYENSGLRRDPYAPKGSAGPDVTASDLAQYWSIVALGLMFSGAGVALFLAQVMVFLKDGVWHDLPVLLVAQSIASDSFMRWLEAPQSWTGLHAIVVGVLKNVPLCVALFLVGLPMIGHKPTIRWTGPTSPT